MIRLIAEIGSVHDGSFGNAQKLIEAAAGIACLLLQNSGQPHTGLMYAHGHVGPYVRFSIMATVVSLGCAFLFIPVFGVWGVLLSIFIQQIVLRVAIQLYVAKIQTIPFQDGWLLTGLALVLPVVALQVFAHPSLSVKIMYGTVVVAGIALAYAISSRQRSV